MPSLNLTPASLQKYTVGPHIQVSARRQIPLLPIPVLALPLRRQTGNHRRRQVRRILAQQRRQCLLEVSGRDATQIKNRQKRIQALRSPCPRRQDRRGEAARRRRQPRGIFTLATLTAPIP